MTDSFLQTILPNSTVYLGKMVKILLLIADSISQVKVAV